MGQDKKTIVIVTSKTKSIYVFRLSMIKYFKENGMDVIAIGNEEDLITQKALDELEVDLRLIPVERNGVNPIKDLVYMFKLKSLLKEIKPDYLFLYQAKPIVYGSIVSSNDTRTISLLAGLGSVIRGKQNSETILRKILLLQYKFALRNNDLVIFHNEDDRKYMIERKIVSQDLSSVVYGSGVSQLDFPKQDYQFQNKKKVFLFVGRLLTDKGIYEFVEAAREIKKLYGDKVIFKAIGNLDTNPTSLKQSDIKRFEKYVEFLGYQEDISKYLVESYALIHPSYHEGLPKVVVEAMAVGRPIITTNTPGCRETVINEKNGFVVQPQSSKEICKAIVNLLEMSKDEYVTMCDASNSIFNERFSDCIVNEKIFKLIEQSCNK